jgi:8-oxo-dGTP pyrophosphatase MutT (NUDIX family)
LLRDVREGTRQGVEVLLVRRSGRARFVPGAYVFPGGVVDRYDSSTELLERVESPSPERAAERLALALGAEPPAIAYYVAAARETFEETGILVAASASGVERLFSAGDARVAAARDAMLEERTTFAEALRLLGCRLDLAALEYIAHWITPESEPRRYDTRFFMASVPAGVEPAPDPRETTEALWIRPAEALLRWRKGALSMILPTVRTLERLVPYTRVGEAFGALAGLPVPAILPASGPERDALPPPPLEAD